MHNETKPTGNLDPELKNILLEISLTLANMRILLTAILQELTVEELDEEPQRLRSL